jgi:hypothetical protein
MGWHVAERHPKYGVIRWSGPETVSHLSFSIKTDNNLILKFDILQSIATDILDSLIVRVNGVSVPLTRQDGNDGQVVFNAYISRDILRISEELTKLTFELNRTICPQDVDVQNSDQRLLGLCYHKLSLTPA